MPTRPHPFPLLFGQFRTERFPAIAAELGESSGIEDFVLAGAALELMRELRPDEGLGADIDDFVALVHAAYRFWRDQEETITVDSAKSRRLCQAARDGTPHPTRNVPAITRYIQVDPRLIWARLSDDGPFEPLDGWFRMQSKSGLRVVACLGVHAERPGVSVTVADGVEPRGWRRPDGSLLFAPGMSGGAAAELFSISAPEELLMLGWRALDSEELILESGHGGS